MSVPCEGCICLAVCRHKYFLDLVDDCSLVYEIVQDALENKTFGVYADVTNQIRKSLKTNKWNKTIC